MYIFILVRIKSYLVRNNKKLDKTSSSHIASKDEIISKDSIQSQMLKEIEDYIEKNIDEMHRAVEELKISFEDEINSMDGR